jgi:peptidoglycan/LPS O-acetylase OafA/YrhL
VLSGVGQGHGLTLTFLLTLTGVSAATVAAADVLWRLVERLALQRRLPWRQAEFAPAAAAAPARG